MPSLLGPRFHLACGTSGKDSWKDEQLYHGKVAAESCVLKSCEASFRRGYAGEWANLLLVDRPQRTLIVAQLRVDAEVPDGLVDVGRRDDFYQRIFADSQLLRGRDSEPVLAG